MKIQLRNYPISTHLMILALLPLLIGYTRGVASNYYSGPVAAEYTGFYACAQGLTGLRLQVLPSNIAISTDVIFNFGPPESNPSVPFGAFLVRGTFYLAGGRLDLHPVSWLSQPVGYTMVGLSGISSDGGETFEGNVLQGSGCTTFAVHRVFVKI